MLPLSAPSPPRCCRAGALADEKAELITTATERERESGCLLVAGQDGVFAKLWFVAKAVGEVQR